VAERTPKYLSRPSSFLVRPAPGWVDLVAGEFAQFVANPVSRYKFAPELKVEKGVIRASNVDFRQAMEWTMRSLTAHDVEWEAWEGRCTSWKGLAKACDEMKASGFLPGVVKAHVAAKANASFVVSSAVIREHFLEALGASSDENAEMRFRLDLYRDRLRVLVSLAGEPLYKRGYKKHLTGAAAPLPEHQAAACIRATLKELGGASAGDFAGVYVPFAGTGTLAFESVAAQMGLGGSSFGRRYAFESFAGMPEATIAHIRKKLAPDAARLAPLVCVERSEDVLSDLRDNAGYFCDLAGISPETIHVAGGDFFKADGDGALRRIASHGTKILMLLNPPYGQRLKAPAEARKYFNRIAGCIADLEMKTGAAISGMCLIPDESASAAFVKLLKKTHKSTTTHFTHGGADMRLVVFRHHPVDM